MSRRSAENEIEESILMQVTKRGGFGNTTLIGGITMRRIGTLVIAIFLGYMLWKTPIFNRNIFAIIAYIAFASVCLGQTPTGRNILTNIYGIVFKKPANMIVSEDMTISTVGHGIQEVDLTNTDLDAIPFRMVGTKNYALVYNITSGINRWSTEDEKIRQARAVKSLFNILEGGESLMLVFKQDNDTGMLKLKESLEERENFEGDDLAAMAKTRRTLLHNAGTLQQGQSVQQYAILMVKPRNVGRTINGLRKMSRITRPASNPADVMFAAMGFEGGIEWTKHTAKAKQVVKETIPEIETETQPLKRPPVKRKSAQKSADKKTEDRKQRPVKRKPVGMKSKPNLKKGGKTNVRQKKR